jgi:serine/threonine protein phosphatase 1
MSRLFAVPDIHGRNDLLQRLLQTLRSDLYSLDLTQDKLIFMGDMIDRGPDSKGVLDTVRKLESDHPGRVIVLRGNHEGLCLNALRRGRWDDISTWLYPGNGGGATLGSFNAEASNRMIPKENPIPDEYLDWMENLPNFHEEPGFFFSHAPVPKEKDRPSALRDKPFTDWELTWTYFEDERGKSRHHKDKEGKDVVGVCGHIHRLSRGLFSPRYYEHYLFLDAGSGCSPKAPLVCTEVKSRTPIEIWPDGVTPIIPPKREYIPQPRPLSPFDVAFYLLFKRPVLQ